MLRWCSYCQQFQGEVPPYHNLAITHGICRSCADGASELLTERNMEHARTLQAFHRRLGEAGAQHDTAMGARLIDEAATRNIRPVDVLVGLIAPMLYEIGDGWERGEVTVEDEHRFTAFCEGLVDVIAGSMDTPVPLTQGDQPQGGAVLMSAFGNEHTLSVRVLTLWLASRGVRSCVADPAHGTEGLVDLLRRVRPERLLVSISLVDQRPGVVAVVDAITALPAPLRPRILVGGYAVKMGALDPIPGVEQLADISLL